MDFQLESAQNLRRSRQKARSMKLFNSRIFTRFILFSLFLLLFSACSAKVDIGVQGGTESQEDSGTIGIEIGLESDSPEEQSNSSDNSAQNDTSQRNEPIVFKSEGLLLLISIGLIVLIALLFGLARISKR